MNDALLFANDQTVNGYCVESGKYLWLFMYDISFGDAITLLLNSENLEKIRAQHPDGEKEIAGYDHFFYISEEENGSISAGIKKKGQ